MKTWRRLLVPLLALALLAGACGDDDDPVVADGNGSGSASEVGRIVVGSADFAESSLVASMYAQVLEHAGHDVGTELDVGARELYFEALQSGELSLVPEFVGSLTVYLGGEGDADTEEALENLRAVLPEGYDILDPTPAESANTFVVTAETAEEHGLSSVSDLQGKDDLVLGGPPECPERPFCMVGLQTVYEVDFSERFRPLDAGGPLTKEALTNGDIDVALLFTTDPGIPANDWVVLEDDRNLQQAENVVPVIDVDVATDEVRQLLNDLSAELDQDTYVELIGRVYIDGEDVEDVATSWLEDNGFLD